MSRPEDQLPPDLYYNEKTSTSYTTNTRVQRIQAEMTHRALSLLNLQTPSLILDIGAGSGLSGQILSSIEQEEGGPHTWVGLDISASMLAVALEREVEGDLMLADAGQGLAFRPGTFDAAISISAIQWLCNAESSVESAEGRLKRFFEGLYFSLVRGGKAVCQFYPRDAQQKNMVAAAAIRAGFGAGLLEDNAGTKAAKVYLVLSVGGSGDITGVVAGMDGVDVQDDRRKGGDGMKMKRGKVVGGMSSRREEILRTKDRIERKGRVAKKGSKFTGRKRRIQF